mgnify:CR=1 FL=1
MNWINNRLKERTSWDGATLIGFGVVVVPLLSYVHMAL